MLSNSPLRHRLQSNPVTTQFSSKSCTGMLQGMAQTKSSNQVGGKKRWLKIQGAPLTKTPETICAPRRLTH